MVGANLFGKITVCLTCWVTPNWHEQLKTWSPFAEMGVYSPDMLVDLLPQVQCFPSMTLRCLFCTPPSILYFLSITNDSSPTLNMHGGFNTATWTRTTWPTGWYSFAPLSGGLIYQLQKYFIYFRELSFTLADDIYIRYLSFTGADDLEAEMIKRFFSIPTRSRSLFQCLDALTRLTLVRFTMLDQPITRSWPTFHRRLSSNLESNWKLQLG